MVYGTCPNVWVAWVTWGPVRSLVAWLSQWWQGLRTGPGELLARSAFSQPGPGVSGVWKLCLEILALSCQNREVTFVLWRFTGSFVITLCCLHLRSKGSHTKKFAATYHTLPQPFLWKDFSESFWGFGVFKVGTIYFLAGCSVSLHRSQLSVLVLFWPHCVRHRYFISPTVEIIKSPDYLACGTKLPRLLTFLSLSFHICTLRSKCRLVGIF